MSIECKTSEIPQASGMMIVSLIKSALKEINEDYFKKLYLYGDKKNKKTKNFTFSTYIKDYELKDEIFIVKDKIIINISIADIELGINLYNGLLKMKTFKYKNYSLYNQKINLIREKQIIKNEVVFKTLSPIFIKDKDNNSILFTNEKFNRELNYIADVILKEYRGYGLKQQIYFEVIKMKKIVSKIGITEFKEKTNKEFICLDTNSGIFKLSGDIEDLRDLYMLGLGFRRNEGLGMIEVL